MTTQCQHCGTEVTDQFARVFGDNTDTLHRCPDCTTDRGLYNGRTANPDRQEGTFVDVGPGVKTADSEATPVSGGESS